MDREEHTHTVGVKGNDALEGVQCMLVFFQSVIDTAKKQHSRYVISGRLVEHPEQWEDLAPKGLFGRLRRWTAWSQRSVRQSGRNEPGWKLVQAACMLE